ncbi:helix-turn-helix transcriptional regulator [Solicola gregarius]|uniref:Helix-turn-helix transcriptional regulator n=1 Tax=Solicola gregarius TaxID=2908642 RepID=A0AA46YN09_9ACTN|nr:helix-turn-helix transcriptional regulator [Solicola gregarius]UYM07139.1 helix-turn-helix transcriptional regulator [Solicola gregarius]
MPSASDSRRTSLAEFLRTRRERITPDDVGLPSGGRRRTPGLRREEVAQLAGVGVTWYTWLEQGRRINASVQVLDAIARTLRMDPQERWHLLQLAGVAVSAETSVTAVPDSVEAILRQLEPFPACVLSERYDILAYNRAYRFMVGDLDTVDPSERNHAWLFFTNAYWGGMCLNRGPAARHLVNMLRAAMAPHLDDPLWTSLVSRLREASEEFDALWKRHDVTSLALPEKSFRSPYGDLHLRGTRMSVGVDGLNRMLVYSPRDDETIARLERLCAEGVPADTRTPQPATAG